jgi:hypothetical protein
MKINTSSSRHLIKPKTSATRRASYLDGLDFIARNDDPASWTEESILAGLISVKLLGALFGIPPEDVAFDLIRTHGYIDMEKRVGLAASGDVKARAGLIEDYVSWNWPRPKAEQTVDNLIAAAKDKKGKKGT